MTALPDRLRPVPASLANEAQVFTALETLVQQPVSQTTMAAIARSGLLAISIPADFGGADISNAIVAEMISKVCAWNMPMATLLVRHFIALEHLRVCGTTEQRRLLYSRVVLGEIFSLIENAHSAPQSQIRRSGLSYEIETDRIDVKDTWADWYVVSATAPEGNVAAIFGKHTLAQSSEVSSQTISPDNVLEQGAFALALAALMQSFLEAAICRGTRQAAPDTASSSVELELLDAMIFKAATAIDAFQVEPSTLELSKVDIISAALETARRRASCDITHLQ